MPDGRLECPVCGQMAPVMWLGNRLVYRPHNDRNGNRCRGPRRSR